MIFTTYSDIRGLLLTIPNLGRELTSMLCLPRDIVEPDNLKECSWPPLHAAGTSGVRARSEWRSSLAQPHLLLSIV